MNKNICCLNEHSSVEEQWRKYATKFYNKKNISFGGVHMPQMWCINIAKLHKTLKICSKILIFHGHLYAMLIFSI